MAAELPPSTRHQSRSRSPSPSAIPQSGPTSSSVVVDPYANHSANAATLNSPPESSHRKRSRSRSPSYTRRRSPSPSSAYQDRPKSFAENSFNGASKGPLPGAVSIYGAASGGRAPRDGDDRGAGGQGGGGGAGNGERGFRYPRRDGDDRGAGGAGGGGGPKNNGVCYAWPTGTCRYGDNCFFKHLDESGREVRKDGPPQRPMLPKRNPAAYPAGAPYRAQHFGGGGGGGGSMSASSGSSYPPSNLCYEFRNEGRCRYGSRCRYSHDTNAAGGSGAAAGPAAGAAGAPHSQMAAAAPYGGGRREFYGGDRYNAGPAGMPYPPHGPHFSHRRRSRSRERRSRSRSPRAHRSRSR